MFVKLLVGIVSGAAVLLVALLDYVWSDKRRREFRRGRQVLLWVLGFLWLGSTYTVYHEGKDQETKAAALASQLQRMEASSRELSQKAVDAVIGGTSFCYLTVVPIDLDRAVFMFVHQGDNHLYDLQARIVDLDRLDTIPAKPGMFDAFLAAGNTIQLASLLKGHVDAAATDEAVGVCAPGLHLLHREEWGL
jgi:hypothetical protein